MESITIGLSNGWRLSVPQGITFGEIEKSSGMDFKYPPLAARENNELKTLNDSLRRETNSNNFPKFPPTSSNEKRIVFELCPQSYLYGEKDFELSDGFMEEYLNKEEEQNKNSSLSQKRLYKSSDLSTSRNNKKSFKLSGPDSIHITN